MRYPPVLQGFGHDSSVSRQTHSAQHSPRGPHLHAPHLQCPPGGEFGEGEDGGHPAWFPCTVLVVAAVVGAECGQEQPRAQPCPSSTCPRSIRAPPVGCNRFGRHRRPGAGPGGKRRRDGRGGEGIEEEITGWLKHTKEKETKIQNQSIQTEINPKLFMW